MGILLTLIILLSVFEVKGKINSGCFGRAECKNTNNRFLPLCYCDVKCFAYKDCCPGYYEANKEKNLSIPTLQNPESCKLLTNQIYSVSERIGAFMVDRCKDTGSTCATTSGNWSTILPVSHANTTYQNANCALCNNVTNFKHWKIAFVVDQKNKLKIKTKRLTSDEAIFKEVINGSFSDDLFYLQPPVLVDTRFCPYDALKNHELENDMSTHQNPIHCDKTFYKNEEECFQDGCCKTRDGSCQELYLKQFKDDNSWSRGGDSGLSMLIEFQQFEKDNLLEEMTVEKITISGLDLYLVIELNITDEGTRSVDTCVCSIIAYLGTSTYKLFPLALRYYVKTMEEPALKVFYILMKSATKLTLTKVADVLMLQHQVRCEERYSGDVIAYGKVNTSSMYDERNSQDEINRIVNLLRYRKPLSSSTSPCANLSFVIQKADPKSMVEMRCLDEIPSRFTSNRESCLIPSLFVVNAALVILALSE